MRTVTDHVHLNVNIDFAKFGIGALAYMKPIARPEGQFIAIYTADGTHVASASDNEQAITLIRNYEMQPMLVH